MPEGGIVGQLRRLATREDVFQGHVLDEEERPGAELLDQPLDRGLDALDRVATVVRGAELRFEEIIRHCFLLRFAFRRDTA